MIGKFPDAQSTHLAANHSHKTYAQQPIFYNFIVVRGRSLVHFLGLLDDWGQKQPT
jgi:hypothetical protein